MTTYSPVRVTRPCPVRHCPRNIANGHCMCKWHWSLVPTLAQDRELAAFRAWCRGAISDDEYHEAMWGAVRAAQDYQRSGDRPADQAKRRTRPGEPRVFRILPDVPRPQSRRARNLNLRP